MIKKLIKRKKKVSVQEQYLLLLQILPKFWSKFQLIGLKSTQRHKKNTGLTLLGTTMPYLLIAPAF